jgi:hypothetical protein
MRTSVAEAAGSAANYHVAPGVSAALKSFVLPDKLGFGLVSAPVMFSAEWSDGAWGRGELTPYGPIEILPGARALHYGELVIEGLKAYKGGDGNPNLFRPHENWQRLRRSAERLSIPPVPEGLFFEAIEAMVELPSIHSTRIGTLLVFAAVPRRHRGGLSAAQFHHLSLHAHRQSGGNLFVGSDAGRDRTR